ncbi:demethylmenaquinone methyltransferase [Bacillus fonticola]|uniref:demethylmenaquinone methyltransferase n=1 Tax=Bacillus fonticola TaxID=2728853 RepID=UPI0038991C5A
MATKEERVHKVFEKISGQYDQMNSVISFSLHKRWRNDTMRILQVRQGQQALDVCCGTGDWTISLAEAVGPTGTVCGLDFSQNMLNVGIEKTKQLPQVNMVHGNAMELPYEDNTFDVVTIGFGLRNVPDLHQVLREMYRVVKPGGKCACLETSQPTMPIYKQLYYGYFRFIMPLFGRLFAKSYEEYSWLQESARDFPNRNTLKAYFHQAGFSDVFVKSYSGGAAALHIGSKQK